MRLTDANTAIRPRTAWEAPDLGTLMARRHATLLISSWALPEAVLAPAMAKPFDPVGSSGGARPLSVLRAVLCASMGDL